MAVEIGDYRGAGGLCKAFRTPCALHLPISGGSIRAAPGDWVVLAREGDPLVYASDDFARSFRPAGDGMSAPAVPRPF